MKQFAIITILCSLAMAYQADVADDNNAVDANDLAVFMNYWLDVPVVDPNCDFNVDGSIDFIDYAILASEFFGTLQFNFNVYSPVANDVNVLVTTYVVSEVQFNVTDEDSSVLDCIITSLPATGQLFDIDKAINDGGGVVPRTLANLTIGYAPVNSIPYRVKRHRSVVYYYTVDSNNTSFAYKASDGVNESNVATVTFDITDYAEDALTIADGYVVIDDNDVIEFDDSFTFCLWVQPKKDFCTLIKKRSSSGAGVELGIRSKHVRCQVWDANNHGEVRSLCPLPLDEWTLISFTGNADGVALYFNGSGVVESNSVPLPPYSNDANMIMGGRYAGEFDRMSFYNYKDSLSVAMLSGELRTGHGGGLFVPTDYTARWNFDEGIGTVITDSVVGLTGQCDANTGWLPDSEPSMKVKVQFHKLGD